MPVPFLADGPSPALVAMLHVPALPGTPAHRRSMEEIVSVVLEEAVLLAETGVDAVMLENMHDVPYLRGAVGPEITAAMTAIAAPVAEVFPGPVGVQVLAAANREAMAVALAAGLEFVRVEGFVFGHLADEGWIDATAGPLLRFRREIGAGHVAILADVKKKHAAHSATADVSLAETVHAAEFCGADGVVVSGEATGRATDPGDLEVARAATDLPVVVGSGVTAANAARYASADALIVGSALKDAGDWRRPVMRERVADLVAAIRRLRS
jgi:membrane complex biogenesis BtpA family protein